MIQYWEGPAAIENPLTKLTMYKASKIIMGNTYSIRLDAFFLLCLFTSGRKTDAEYTVEGHKVMS